MMKKKWLIRIPVLLLLITIGLGGKFIMDQINEGKRMQEYMLEAVKSKAAKEVFEKGLRNLDPNALTPNGVIQSYQVDYDSISHNPMGGIDGIIIVNNDAKLEVDFRLNKENDGHFSSEYVIVGTAPELDAKLREGGLGE